jgi:hypothetical protein
MVRGFDNSVSRFGPALTTARNESLAVPPVNAVPVHYCRQEWIEIPWVPQCLSGDCLAWRPGRNCP